MQNSVPDVNLHYFKTIVLMAILSVALGSLAAEPSPNETSFFEFISHEFVYNEVYPPEPKLAIGDNDRVIRQVMANVLTEALSQFSFTYPYGSQQTGIGSSSYALPYVTSANEQRKSILATYRAEIMGLFPKVIRECNNSLKANGIFLKFDVQSELEYQRLVEKTFSDIEPFLHPVIVYQSGVTSGDGYRFKVDMPIAKPDFISKFINEFFKAVSEPIKKDYLKLISEWRRQEVQDQISEQLVRNDKFDIVFLFSGISLEKNGKSIMNSNYGVARNILSKTLLDFFTEYQLPQVTQVDHTRLKSKSAILEYQADRNDISTQSIEKIFDVLKENPVAFMKFYLKNLETEYDIKLHFEKFQITDASLETFTNFIQMMKGLYSEKDFGDLKKVKSVKNDEPLISRLFGNAPATFGVITVKAPQEVSQDLSHRIVIYAQNEIKNQLKKSDLSSSEMAAEPFDDTAIANKCQYLFR